MFFIDQAIGLWRVRRSSAPVNAGCPCRSEEIGFRRLLSDAGDVRFGEASDPQDGAPAPIRLWAASAILDEPLLNGTGILTEDDLAAAERFPLERHRRRHLGSRALLRLALSAHCEAWPQHPAPDEWRFLETPHGRPAIDPDLPQLHFSLSHIAEGTLIATADGHRLGIDIEPANTTLPDSVLACFLSPGERRQLRSYRHEARQRAALQLWTMKEAYSKLLGTGLSGDFRDIEIAIPSRRVLSDPEIRLESWTTRFGGRRCYLSLAYAAADSPPQPAPVPAAPALTASGTI